MRIVNLIKLTVITLLCCHNLWAAKLAIVIDDLGYRKNDLKILQMDQNISVAIIPSSPHAPNRDKLAFEQGRDILIHMPMDSGRNKIEAEVIKIGMDKATIRSRLDYAESRVPHAIGLNNHMGTQGTANHKLMEDFVDVFKADNKFVLDSMVSGRSCLAKTAKAAGIKTLKRNVFLDDNNSIAAINQAFDLAITTARKKGVAIAIGHPRIHTVAVLKQRLKNLPADIELVKISSLLPLDSMQDLPQDSINLNNNSDPLTIKNNNKTSELNYDPANIAPISHDNHIKSREILSTFPPN